MRNVGAIMCVVSGLVLGFAGGAVLVGRAQAQTPPPATAPRFQYKCITGLPAQIYKPDALAAVNREGANGWQLLDGLSGQNHLSGADQYCFVKQY